MPMDKNSTPFLNYCQIDTSSADLYSDAFGFEYRLQEMMSDYENICKKPDDRLVKKLLQTINRVVDKY
jgi:hypothetical protein